MLVGLRLPCCRWPRPMLLASCTSSASCSRRIKTSCVSSCEQLARYLHLDASPLHASWLFLRPSIAEFFSLAGRTSFDWISLIRSFVTFSCQASSSGVGFSTSIFSLGSIGGRGSTGSGPTSPPPLVSGSGVSTSALNPESGKVSVRASMTAFNSFIFLIRFRSM